jgi:hypothetical protein
VVDLNALIEEALNLAYHGARAQDAGFNTSNTKPQRPHRYPGIYHLYKDGAQAFMKIFPGVCDPSNSRHIIIEMGSDFSIGRPFDEALPGSSAMLSSFTLLQTPVLVVGSSSWRVSAVILSPSSV